MPGQKDGKTQAWKQEVFHWKSPQCFSTSTTSQAIVGARHLCHSFVFTFSSLIIGDFANCFVIESYYTSERCSCFALFRCDILEMDWCCSHLIWIISWCWIPYYQQMRRVIRSCCLEWVYGHQGLWDQVPDSQSLSRWKIIPSKSARLSVPGSIGLRA